MAKLKRLFLSVIHHPIALLTGLSVPLGVMFNVIYSQPFARKYGFVPTVGWGILTLADSLVLFLPQAYRISQADWVSIFDLFDHCLSGNSLRPFSPLSSEGCLVGILIAVVSVVTKGEPLSSSAILSVLFLGLVLDSYPLLAMILIIILMIFFYPSKNQKTN